MTSDQWKKRFLIGFKLGKGKLPSEYPYNHWWSWIQTGKGGQAMYEGFIMAATEYEKKLKPLDNS